MRSFACQAVNPEASGAPLVGKVQVTVIPLINQLFLLWQTTINLPNNKGLYLTHLACGLDYDIARNCLTSKIINSISYSPTKPLPLSQPIWPSTSTSVILQPHLRSPVHWALHLIYMYSFVHYIFIYFWLYWLFVAAWAFSSCSKHGLLIAAASIIAEQGL